MKHATRIDPAFDYITTTDELAALCDELAAEKFITVDTEFMREKTFWPRLCLVQVAGENRAAIIDPLAEGIDLAPFFKLLADANVLKVFHAGRQDIEIFHHLAGVIPYPLFDTQIAAMVCGFGDQVGYEQLVNKLAKASIDKSSRFTDWARRPLTDKQLSYAIADVTHLRVIFDRLCGMIRQSGREPWLKEEMEILASPATYAQAPEDAWKRLKSRLRKPRQIAALRALAAWREREAQGRDLPRRRVLKDEALIELATQMPTNEEQLAALRSISPGQARSATGRALLKVIAEVKALPEEALPAPREEKRRPAPGAGAKADILKLALKIVSEREHIAPKLIASAADLERIAAGETDVPALKGWRRVVFGDLAQKLLAGEMMIGIRDGKPAIMPT